MSFTEVWNEAYNLYAELADNGNTVARKATKDMLVCHAKEGDILPSEVNAILDDVMETYEL